MITAGARASIDAAIARVGARDNAERMRREIAARLVIERTDLEFAIQFPWLPAAERRRFVLESFHPRPLE